MLATLMVPAGSATPATFRAAPGAGAVETVFARSAELTAAMGARELTTGVVGAPPGFELFGYASAPVAESSAQEFTWTIEATLGLPGGAGGGSFGGPFKATAIMGWRRVRGAPPPRDRSTAKTPPPNRKPSAASPNRTAKRSSASRT
jgi:hypothetical protein